MNTTSTEPTGAESLARPAQHRRKLLLGFFVVLGLVGMFEGWQWSCMRRSLSRIEQELNRRKVVQVNFPRTELLQLLAGWSAQSSMNTDRGRRDVIVWRGLLHHHVLWVDSNSADEVLAVEIGEVLDMAVALQPPDGLPVHRAPSTVVSVWKNWNASATVF